MFCFVRLNRNLKRKALGVAVVLERTRLRVVQVGQEGLAVLAAAVSANRSRNRKVKPVQSLNLDSFR